MFGARACRSAGRCRRADQQRHRNASAGALAVPRRPRGKRTRAFLFTQPTDGKGARYDMAVLVAGLAANPRSLSHRLRPAARRDRRRLGEGARRAARAAPRRRCAVPGHLRHRRRARHAGNGLDGLPVPISTPGFDNAPYLSAGHYITKDPDTGRQNVGNYRGQLKAPRRLGMNPSVELRAGIYAHWLKYKERGEPMPCAVVVGLSAARLLCGGAEDAGKSRRAMGRRRARRLADQRGAGQDRRSSGAGGSRDRHRRLYRHRISGAGGAVRRIRTATSICRNTMPS